MIFILPEALMIIGHGFVPTVAFDRTVPTVALIEHANLSTVFLRSWKSFEVRAEL